MLLDDYLKNLIKSQGNNICIPWYLIASYAYYHLDKPIISDAMFDKLAVIIRDNYDTISHHHKNWLLMMMLLPEH